MGNELIVFFLSSILVVVGIILWKKGNRLLVKGKKSEAIIFKNNYSPDSEGGGVYYPVIRFLTDKQEWITKELSIGYFPPKRVGKKFEVIYDPNNPTDVEINSVMQLEIIPRLLVSLGVAGFVFGILEFLNIISVIPN